MEKKDNSVVKKFYSSEKFDASVNSISVNAVYMIIKNEKVNFLGSQ